MKFHFIYLAAGFSKRFGGNKLLAVYDGIPMYRALLDRLGQVLDSRDDVCDITVVTQYEEIKAEVLHMAESSAKPIRCVINPDPSRGISSSLQCGIRSVCEEVTLCEDTYYMCGKADSSGDIYSNSDDFLVCFVADAPKLSRGSVERFLSAFAESGNKLGCMGEGGQMGNPCAFAFKYIPELMELTGDKGGKRVLTRHRDEVFIFSDIKVEELEDIDYKC